MKKTRRDNGAGIYLAANKGACAFDWSTHYRYHPVLGQFDAVSSGNQK